MLQQKIDNFISLRIFVGVFPRVFQRGATIRVGLVGICSCAKQVLYDLSSAATDGEVQRSFIIVRRLAAGIMDVSALDDQPNHGLKLAIGSRSREKTQLLLQWIGFSAVSVTIVITN
jgi:hypothetical protein